MDKTKGCNVALKVDGLFDPSDNSFTMSGELQPATPLVHHQLAVLFEESDPPEASVEFKNVNNVLTLTVKLTHDKDVAKLGHRNLALVNEATERGMSVSDLVKEKKSLAAIAKKAAAKADKGSSDGDGK